VSPSVVLGAVIALVAAWVLLIALLWFLRPRDVSLRELVGVVPDVLRLVRDLISDRSTPTLVRLALIVLLVWIVSPIDLIPEFIPVLGPLDDVVVAVLVLRYVRRRLGEEQLRRRWRGSADGFALLTGVIGRDAA
jgi:uncharacterized membrane protein YkvA (DUF1232 family)